VRLQFCSRNALFCVRQSSQNLVGLVRRNSCISLDHAARVAKAPPHVRGDLI